MNMIKILALAAAIAMLAACDKQATEEAAAPVVEEVPAVEAAAPMEAAPAEAAPAEAAPAEAAPAAK